MSSTEYHREPLFNFFNFYLKKHPQTQLSNYNVPSINDDKSVLEALENDNSKDKAIQKLSRIIGEVIANHGINITLQSVPRHTNVQGKERADTLAKQGARYTGIQQNITISMTTAKDNQTT